MSAYQSAVLATAGLAAFLEMQETVGTVAADSSTNGHPGTYHGGFTLNQPGVTFESPTTATASVGFDGNSGSYVTVPGPVLSNANASLECWAECPSLPCRGAFMYTGVGSGSQAGWGMGVGDGSDMDGDGTTLMMIFDAVRWINTGVQVQSGFHHYVMTLDASGHPSLYVDGELVYSDEGEGPESPPTGIYVGGYGSRCIAAHIEQGAPYTVCLTADQVTAHFTAGTPHYIAPTGIGGASYDELIASNPDLTHWWPLDGDPTAATDTAYWQFPDLGPSDVELAVNTVDAYQQVPGLVGSSHKAAEVLNVYDFIYTNTDGIQPRGTDFSLEIWVYLSAAPVGSMPLMSDGGSQYQCLMLTPYGLAFAQYYNGWSQVEGDFNWEAALGGWHHIMATVDPSADVSLYVDGTLVGSGSGQNPGIYSNYFLGYGYCPFTSGWSYFSPNGGETALAHAAIYAHCQSAAVAAQHYIAGSSLAGATSFGDPTITYGSMHMHPAGIAAASVGVPAASGGKRVGRPLAPMILRRGALGR